MIFQAVSNLQAWVLCSSWICCIILDFWVWSLVYPNVLASSLLYCYFFSNLDLDFYVAFLLSFCFFRVITSTRWIPVCFLGERGETSPPGPYCVVRQKTTEFGVRKYGLEGQFLFLLCGQSWTRGNLSESVLFFKPVTHLNILCVGSLYKYHLLRIMMCFASCVVSELLDLTSACYRGMKDLRPCGAGEGPEWNIAMVPKVRVRVDSHFIM